jgi:hypothetical protein
MASLEAFNNRNAAMRPFKWILLHYSSQQLCQC